MTREERRLVTAIRDKAVKLLAAEGYAEAYMARREFTDALAALQDWALESAGRQACGAARSVPVALHHPSPPS